MTRRGPFAVVAVLLAGCGGAGDPAPPEQTAVAGVQFEAPSAGDGTAPAPAPAPALPAPPAAPGATGSTEGPSAAAATPAPVTPAPVTRGALIAALKATRSWKIVGDTPDGSMSEVTGGIASGVLGASSNLRPLARPDLLDAVTVAVDVAVGADALSFNGSGTVSSRRGDATATAETITVSGPQSSIGPTTVLPATLAEWGAQGTPYGVRLTVDAEGLRSGTFRLCWRTVLPTGARDRCTLHAGTDGASIGARATYALDTGTVVHRSDEDDPNPRRVLSCARTIVDPLSTPTTIDETYDDVFRFVYPVLTRFATSPVTFAGVSDDDPDFAEQTLADGTVRYTFTPTRAVRFAQVTLDVKSAAPVGFLQVSGPGVYREECR